MYFKIFVTHGLGGTYIKSFIIPLDNFKSLFNSSSDFVLPLLVSVGAIKAAGNGISPMIGKDGGFKLYFVI